MYSNAVVIPLRNLAVPQEIATEGNFCEIVPQFVPCPTFFLWDVATWSNYGETCQLQDPCGCYRVYVALTGLLPPTPRIAMYHSYT